MCLQQVGTIHVAAFSDANLYAEVANKAFFWMQPSFYNIDITCLHKDAAAGYFTQVRPPALAHHVLVSSNTAHHPSSGTCIYKLLSAV